MELKQLGKIRHGQDGAIYGDYIFRFDGNGFCAVYKLDNLTEQFSCFTLDRADLIPHSNSVAFGNEKYNESDEFPLLYSNIYNNFAKTENKLKGVTCVYRLLRDGNTFTTTLVQLIEIGFTEDVLWRSENTADVRPYGNFAIDTENSVYYAFTMRDEDKTTRYFSFPLPKCADGEFDKSLGVKRIFLQKKDVIDYFDCEYHHFLQGACFHKGVIYSVEGFGEDPVNPPAIRLIDTANKKQLAVYYFGDYGLVIEPECIDFLDDTCYYVDNHGHIYNLVF